MGSCSVVEELSSVFDAAPLQPVSIKAAQSKIAKRAERVFFIKVFLRGFSAPPELFEVAVLVFEHLSLMPQGKGHHAAICNFEP